MSSIVRLQASAAPGTGILRRRTSFEQTLLYALLVVLGASFAFGIDLVGRLLLVEMALALVVFTAAIRGRLRVWDGPMRIFLALAGFWLLSQVTADMFLGTAPSDYLRGWFRVIVTTVNVVGFYHLIRGRTPRLIAVAGGLMVGRLLAVSYAATAHVIADPWKFGFAGPVTWGGLIAAGALWTEVTGRPRKVSKFAAMCLVLGLAGINLYEGHRGQALICFLTLGIALVGDLAHKRGLSLSGAGSQKRVLLFVGAFIAMGIAASSTYGYLASSGALGYDAERRYLEQSVGRYGIVVGGRSEVLVATRAILASPVVGHGSWARGPEYVGMLQQLNAQLGYTNQHIGVEQGVIPTHSHLLSAWVEGGPGSALVWLFVLWLSYRALIITFGREHRFQPLLIYVCVSLAWNVLFSPLGTDARVFTALSIAVVLWMVRSDERYREVQGNHAHGALGS